MKRLLLSLFILYWVYSVYGTSDADSNKISLCDAKSERYGCDPTMWTDGKRLFCKNTTQLMSWASKSVKSSCYEIVAGDDATNPVTSYNPDEILLIHLRVLCWEYIYRGLLIYAIDETGKKVGNWEITKEEPVLFKTPWTDPEHSCYGSLMHANAENKPYHSVLYFRTPSAGTGQITFHTLIKWGNANAGAFYWPSTDLVLTEAPKAVETDVYYRMSDVGQSCTELCASQGYVCNDTPLANFSDVSQFTKTVFRNAICVLPPVSGCGDKAATYDPAGQICYYPDANCLSDQRSPATYFCNLQVPGYSRFCSCNDPPASNEQHEDNSSSSILRSSSILLLAGLFITSPKAAIMMLAMLGLSYGHNWLNTPSRSVVASTAQPFKPPLSDMPHIKVGPGQKFQVEWMTAHGGYTYFAILHSSDQGYAKLHTGTLFEDYIKRAPASAILNATYGEYQRFHRKTTNNVNNENWTLTGQDFFTTYSYFSRVINSTDPLFINRPAVCKGRIGPIINPTNTSQIFQLQYNLSELAEDVRVSYESEKYPWLEAVYRFKVTAFQATRPDVANFWIPGRKGFGRYLVHYYWAGYRDAVDVDFVSYNVADIYGIGSPSVTWKRIDHCLFDRTQFNFGGSEILTGLSSDLDWCKKRCFDVTDCDGINVFPIKAPESAYQGFTANSTDHTWIYPQVYGADIYNNWNQTNHMIAARSDLIANATTEKYVCIPIAQKTPTDTIDSKTITRDPLDPIFYSTCYLPFYGNWFPGYENSSSDVALGPWRFNGKCLDCADRYSNVNSTIIPKWRINDKCVDCDLEPATPVIPSYNPIVVEKNTVCDGIGAFFQGTHFSSPCNSTVCYIKLNVPGRMWFDLVTRDPITTLEECMVLASRNPSCSNRYVRIGTACYCYSNSPCCKNCSRRFDALGTVYELTSPPDPTCSTGILSADGKFCCDGTCGAGNCIAKNSTAPAVGFCASFGATRSCAQYGPPCVVPQVVVKKDE